MFRRQPGTTLASPDAPVNFWQLEIGWDGVAILTAQGTPLIGDGNFVGLVSAEHLRRLRSQVDELRAVDDSLLCMHADDFTVFESPTKLSRTACISMIEGSSLAAVYLEAQDTIKMTTWKQACAQRVTR